MFEKSFREMMAVDVRPFIKQRDGADYLPWASCKKLLHDNGAETVLFEPIPARTAVRCTAPRSVSPIKTALSTAAMR